MAKGTETNRKTRARADGVIARWLWVDYVRSRVPFLALAVVFMIVEALSLGAFSYLVQPMFDDVFIQGNRSAVYLVAFGMAGVFFARGLAQLAHSAIIAWQAEQATAQLQVNLLGHLVHLDQGFYQINSPGVLIERVRGDSAALRSVFSSLITGLGRDGAAVIVLFGVALWTDWLWTLIALMGIPLLGLPLLALQRMIRRRSTQARVAAAASSNRLNEAFHGITTLQLTGSEAREVSRYSKIINNFVQKTTRVAIGKAAVPTVMDFGAAIGFALVLIYGGMQIIEGTRTVGQFMSFFTALSLLFDPLRRFTALTAQWQNILASLERTYELLQTRAKVTNPPPPHLPAPDRAEASVELRDVSFAYETEPVLKNLSFIAPAGKTTAIVGPSGAGKTTIFTLLARLADVSSGEVLIGGQDVRKMDLAALRRLFAVVSQDTALFDESLYDNIVMGVEGVTDEALQAALSAAHVDDFLPMLANGLETPAGPRGSSLSGGQRQRVAIARALLRDAPILLLDEATSALDARSEAFVQQALDKLASGRTTLVIAHRLSTVRKADQIIVMDRGQVVERGNHAELLDKGGAYARLYALQFGQQEQEQSR